MKRIILAIAILALVLPATQRAEARVDVSIDFFYNNLNDGGSWIEAGDYGYCWQPSVAVGNPRWRPYSDGYWAYTDVGWTWVSYEDFGWATYHYGRWARLRDQGWIWVPGREWGPSWVSWRTGGDYVGWAPLPPRYGARGGELVYEGRSLSHTVDIDYDIGPSYYNFVDVRYIGEPVLRERIFEPAQNITYINQTVNVTNITYNNSTVYNYGPDYNRLSAYSTRPIRRMTLERQANVDYAMAGQNGEFNKVQGDRLIVAAPPVLQQPSQQQQIAPPKIVKTRIAKPEVETGWMGISDPKAKTELQQKIKKEDPKSIPPPQIQPTNPAALSAAPNAVPPSGPAASPAAENSAVVGAASPGKAMSPNAKGKERNKRGAPEQLAQPSASPAADLTKPNATAAPGAVPRDQKGRGKDKSKRGGNGAVLEPSVALQGGGAASSDAAGSPAASNEIRAKGKDRGNKRNGNQQSGQAAVAPLAGDATAPSASAPDAAKPEQKGKGGNKRNRPEQMAQPTSAPEGAGIPPSAGNVTSSAAPDSGKGKGKRVQRAAPPLETATPVLGGPADNGLSRAAERPERGAYAPAGGENPGLDNRDRKNKRMDLPPPADAGSAAANAPVQVQPSKVERETRLAPAQQISPENAPGAPQGEKPRKGKKEKKGEEAPSPTPAG